MKKLIRSPLFPAIVAAPVLFGIGALVLSLPEYDKMSLSDGLHMFK